MDFMNEEHKRCKGERVTYSKSGALRKVFGKVLLVIYFLRLRWFKVESISDTLT